MFKSKIELNHDRETESGFVETPCWWLWLSTEPNFNLVIHFFFHYSITFASHRMYCKDLKPDKKKNNTEFLMDFNDFIDTKTPNHPLCEYQKRGSILWNALFPTYILLVPSSLNIFSWELEVVSFLILMYPAGHLDLILTTDSYLNHKELLSFTVFDVVRIYEWISAIWLSIRCALKI